MVDKKHLEYIEKAKNPTPAQFDSDWDPIGPQVRFQLLPVYVELRPNGRLYLTATGKKLVANGVQ